MPTEALSDLLRRSRPQGCVRGVRPRSCFVRARRLHSRMFQESGGRRHRPRGRSMAAGQSQREINPQACAWQRRVRVPTARRCLPTDLRTSPHWPWRKVPGDRKKKIARAYDRQSAWKCAPMLQVSIKLNLRVLLRLGRQHPEAAYFSSRVECDSKDHESVFELASNVHPVKVRILPRQLDALELPKVRGNMRPRRAQTIRRHRSFHSIVELGAHLIEMLLPQ